MFIFQSKFDNLLHCNRIKEKSGTSKKIQWDIQISKVGSLEFLDLEDNGSPDLENLFHFDIHVNKKCLFIRTEKKRNLTPVTVKPKGLCCNFMMAILYTCNMGFDATNLSVFGVSDKVRLKVKPVSSATEIR